MTATSTQPRAFGCRRLFRDGSFCLLAAGVICLSDGLALAQSSDRDMVDGLHKPIVLTDVNDVDPTSGKATPSITLTQSIFPASSVIGSLSLDLGRRIPLNFCSHTMSPNCKLPRYNDVYLAYLFQGAINVVGYESTSTDYLKKQAVVTPIGNFTIPEVDNPTQSDGSAYQAGSYGSRGEAITRNSVRQLNSLSGAELTISADYYNTNGSQNSSTPINDTRFISSIAAPNGETVSYYFDTVGVPYSITGHANDRITRVRAVTSNLGYLLFFKYGDDSTLLATDSKFPEWLAPVGIYFINSAYSFCDVVNGEDCSVRPGAKLLAKLDYNFVGQAVILTKTDQSQLSFRFGSPVGSSVLCCLIKSIEKVGVLGSSINYEWRYDGGDPESGPPTKGDSNDPLVAYVTSVTKGASVWKYEYDTDNIDQGFTRSYEVRHNPDSGIDRYVSSLDAGMVTQTTDALGHKSTYSYTRSADDPASFSDIFSSYLSSNFRPEGNGLELIRDLRGNITSVKLVSKSSASTDILTVAFPSECINARFCNKPSYTVDGLGNRTDYTYSPDHGGLLTETGPADASGNRPVRRSSYVQRYPWIVSSSGGYVRANSPIWMLAAQKTCRMSVTQGDSCVDGSADELITTYEYGPDAGPNNLLLRGVAVTADGTTRRTCYTYDAQGNKITETKPLAGLAVCP